jgi:acyl carrier protein
MNDMRSNVRALHAIRAEISMIEAIRKLVDEHGRMPVPAASLTPDQDLYAAGLTSFATVQLMLGIEEHFDIEFPERMLNRRSFASLAAIAACVNEIEPARLAS